MKRLNLPEYSFRTIGEEGSQVIFDRIRKRYVKLTQEEWVRQNFIMYLIQAGGYPPGLMKVESFFRHNRLEKRIDILIHNRKGEPVMIVECKKPDDEFDEKAFEQIATYNIRFRVPYLVVTNGYRHFACKITDYEQGRFDYLNYIPLYADLLN